MKPNPRIGAALFALALVTPRVVRADDSFRLSHDVVPTFEAIRLDLDAGRRSYRGSVTIELQVQAPCDSFRLHARDMTLEGLTLHRRGETIPTTWGGGEQGLLTVRAAHRLGPGPYTLDIAFTNDFDVRANSLYRVEVGGNAYVFSDFEPDDARGAFPCWDEPSFKIPWQVTVTIPKDHRAVSNTLAGRDTVVGDRRRIVFHRTRPLPSYLVAIVAGPLEIVPIRGLSVPGNVVTVQGSGRLAAQAARETPAILAALERYFGRKYPYEKLDLIAVPEFSAGAMENAGAVTYREEVLLMDPASTSPSQRRRLVSTTAHELSHMWFGDLVTLAWWNDTWLNESFASWMGDKVTDEVAPEFRENVEQESGALRAMTADSRLTTRPIRAPALASDNLLQSFDVLTYQKGQAVLEMLERWLGPETFRKGIVAYIRAHEFGNATAGDLWDALSKAAGRDVSKVAGSFVDQPGVPIVSLEAGSAGEVRLSQHRFLADATASPGPARWSIPVTLHYPVGDRVVAQDVLLEDSVATVRLAGGASPPWIHPNADERGYYRWSVPAAMLDAMVGEAARRCTARERVGLAGNLRALLTAGVVRGDWFLSQLARFAGDPDPQVVSAVLDQLASTRFAFVTDRTRADFAAYVRRSLEPALERIGTERTPGESPPTTLLRPKLMRWLGDDGGDTKVLERAQSLTVAYLKDRTAIDPAVAEAALALNAVHGDARIFDDYRTRFETTHIPDERTRFLRAIAACTDTAIVDRALAYAIEGPLRPQEVSIIPTEIATRPEFGERVFNWVLENYDAIAARVPRNARLRLPWFADGCSTERAARAQAFFSEPARARAGIAKEVAKMQASVGEYAGLHERDGAAVATYLSQLAGMK